MIAKLKVTSNVAEIKAAHKAQQEVDEHNKQKGVKHKPAVAIPEMQFKENEILLDVAGVTLAFVNAEGEIAVKYQGDNFNLVYSDEVWDTLKKRFS